ncbi:hypothetical protein EV122DRAFT_281800 [Schizophyllum commune]
MDTGTATSDAVPSVSAPPPATNRRRKWSRFPRFRRRSPPPAYPKHRVPGRKCFVRRLFHRFTRRFTKKRRHISTDTAISAFYSSRIREIDGPVLIPHEEDAEDERAASPPIADRFANTSPTHASILRPRRYTRQRPSSAPSPRHLSNAPAPRTQSANAHSRHNSMPVPQRPSSVSPPLANLPDAAQSPSSASPRPRSASPHTSPPPSLRRSSGRILQEQTSQTPAVVRKGSSPEPLVIQNRERRSSRATPPPIANGPLRAHPETYQTNDALHGDEVQPGPSTSTANRSDPTAMFSTPPPGWTGQTTPEQPQNASAPRFVPAHPSMAPIGELIAAELGAIWERTEEHGRAHEFGSSVRARERSRRSHATTQAALAPQGLATSPPHHSEEAGEEEEEAVVEEGDDFAADNE